MFKIREKVVCISPIDGLIKNEIYIVSDIYRDSFESGIHVKELIPKKTDSGGFYFFSVTRFRKLDYQFAENLLSELTKEFNESHKLISND